MCKHVIKPGYIKLPNKWRGWSGAVSMLVHRLPHRAYIEPALDLWFCPHNVDTHKATKQAMGEDSVLSQCWPTVNRAGPTLGQRWIDTRCCWEEELCWSYAGHEVLFPCWFDVVSASETVAQHWADTGAAPRACLGGHHILWFITKYDGFIENFHGLALCVHTHIALIYLFVLVHTLNSPLVFHRLSPMPWPNSFIIISSWQ